MIHFIPESPAEFAPAPYAEAVARLASIRQALRQVEQFDDGTKAPAIDSGGDDERIASLWPTARAATRRCFTARSERTAGAAAAGLEVLLSQRVDGSEPKPASVELLAGAIRDGIDDLERLLAR